VSRESLREKALRYIADGRLQVVWVDRERVEAHVRSDTTHTVGYQRGGWRCDCEAHRYGQRCSHLAAVQLVCRRPTREPASLTAEQLHREQAEASRVRAGSSRG
jgi:hypothetical protein